jgi:hypothetical protein
MIRLLKYVFIGVIIISCKSTPSNLDKDKNRVDNVCDKFINQFAAGKLDDALEILKLNSVIETSTIDTLKAKIRYQEKNVFPSFGTILSSEFIKESKVKDFITKRFYIIKFSKSFLKVDFTLYNNGSDWTITSFQYNDEIYELLN